MHKSRFFFVNFFLNKRGVLIDSCRHFFDLAMIKRNLHAMASVKLNVLHWHLSEDQGFSIECLKYPLLHEKGSLNGRYYLQSEVKEVVRLADLLGIRVVPEFDIPSHTTSWFVGYPELSADKEKNYEVETCYGVLNPVMNLEEETFTFLDNFFAEMCQLFPDEYFHIGGDENNGRDWRNSRSIQQFMSKHSFSKTAQVQAYFTTRVAKCLAEKHKKIPVGWDEVFEGEGIPKQVVIQSWRGKDSMRSATGKGFKTILSNGYYLDLCQEASLHYLNDPLEDIESKKSSLVLGGECCMWCTSSFTSSFRYINLIFF